MVEGTSENAILILLLLKTVGQPSVTLRILTFESWVKVSVTCIS